MGSESVRGVPPELEQKEMRFRPPQLSDEEERSLHLPVTHERLESLLTVF